MSATHNPSPIEQGAQTRQRLLEVAETLFAEHGFAATSVRDITSAAACNLAAVSYLFRDKQSLYHEVCRRQVARGRRGDVAHRGGGEAMLREQGLGNVQKALPRLGALLDGGWVVCGGHAQSAIQSKRLYQTVV